MFWRSESRGIWCSGRLHKNSNNDAALLIYALHIFVLTTKFNTFSTMKILFNWLWRKMQLKEISYYVRVFQFLIVLNRSSHQYFKIFWTINIIVRSVYRFWILDQQMLVTGAFIATTHPISCGTFTLSFNSCHLVLLLLAEYLSELYFKKVIYKKIYKKVHTRHHVFIFQPLYCKHK